MQTAGAWYVQSEGFACAQALVSGVPKGALVMLDLFAEVFPLWKATESFYGADFIFCMLHNFGGNIEMYGALPAVAALAPGAPAEQRRHDRESACARRA